jgi:hypothetical protein
LIGQTNSAIQPFKAIGYFVEFITQFFQALKSPRTALVLLLFSGALLFFPVEKLGLEQPEFTAEYQAQILVVFFLAVAVLALEIASFFLDLIGAPFRARARQKRTEETFYSLNLEELCVLWVMTQSGTKTIKGDYTKHVMISLRQKDALGLVMGYQNLGEAHHFMPDTLYDLVAERGYDRFPDEFKNSVRFEDEVREIVRRSTDWRR